MALTPSADRAPAGLAAAPQAEARVSRKIAKLVTSFEVTEGVGARVKRSIGTPMAYNITSPFLVLDYARIAPGPGGFPDHPHRGMSTLTYVLEGQMQHEDFMGHVGNLQPGDVQFMSAGRGVVHSEMPIFDDEIPVDAVAVQLWIDMPSGRKMGKPSYQEKKAASMGRASFEGGSIVVVAGESHGAVGPLKPTAPNFTFLDLSLKAGGEIFHPIPEGWTACLYVLEGTLAVGEEAKMAESHQLVILSGAKGKGAKGKDAKGKTDTGEGETGVLLKKTSGKRETRFILFAGEVLDQPVIQQGPFVVTTKEAAVQALRDFDGYKNGFEKAKGWRSAIGDSARKAPRKR